ncbi:MAG: mechanosensitive ion channel family protein [Rhodospirillales bacterium]|nr:mechanosensitive ion channel family protein [Rhodospirillales bacterium]
MDKDLETLKALVIDVWTHGLYGVDIGAILIALLIFAGFMLIRGIFSKFVLTKLHNWAAQSTTKLDDKIVDALIPPIKFVPVILGIFFASQYLSLGDSANEFVMRAERSLIAFTIFWALHRAADPLSHGVKKLEKLLTRAMMQWIFKALKVLIVFIGAAVILEIWGIAVGPLLAGLGLFGAAVALGAQDLFKNLIGGITIIAEKRFHPGEWILVDGVVEGTVEDIGFRSTKVRRFDKAPVHVPNSNLSDAVVTNFSRMTHRRIKWAIGVEYRTTVEQLQIIRDGIMDYITNNDAFATANEVPTFVRVDSFNNSSIDFLVYCFTKTTDWGEWLEIKEDFALAIKQIVEDKAGTAFAFPSQSIYVESLPGEAAEIFVPPGK